MGDRTLFTADLFYINAALVFGTSFLFSFGLYPFWIDWLKQKNVASKGHVDHIIDITTKLKKEKTPSFGGVVFVIIPFLVPLLFLNKIEPSYYMLAALAFCLAIVGLFDDLWKIWYHKDGISARMKSAGQLCSSMLFVAALGWMKGFFTIKIPFVAEIAVNNSFIAIVLCILFLLFVLVGTSNAVNLTDGMDGLASSLSAISYIFLFVIACIQKEEFLAILIASCLGGVLAFLWYNYQPAKIFMGDVGSLPLGGLLAAFAIFLEQEVLLVFLGAMFVIETMSVILQVSYYKRTKKRIFACAPLHHHFQSKGWTEKGIVHRFVFFQLLFCLIGLGVYYICYGH